MTLASVIVITQLEASYSVYHPSEHKMLGQLEWLVTRYISSSFYSPIVRGKTARTE